jgi:hypothetical protein
VPFPRTCPKPFVKHALRYFWHFEQ